MPKPKNLQDVRDFLSAGKPLTARQMAEKMECNERTVRRCVEHLMNHEKWPVEAGSYGYRMRVPERGERRINGPEEIAALAQAHAALQRLGSSEVADKVRDELAKLCRRSVHFKEAGWEPLDGAILEEPAGGESGARQRVFGKLTLLIVQKRLAKLRYRRLEEEQGYEVTVFPHKWIFRDQCWYLVAEDLERGGQKSYAFPRIAAVETALTPDDFQVPLFVDHYAHAFGIWLPADPDAPLHEVCVELHGYWARIARERVWHPSQRVESLAPDHVRVHFRLNELVEVKSWVLKLGGAAKAIAPAELQRLVRDELAEMNRRYARTP